jgi:hypothetical protein
MAAAWSQFDFGGNAIEHRRDDEYLRQPVGVSLALLPSGQKASITLSMLDNSTSDASAYAALKERASEAIRSGLSEYVRVSGPVKFYSKLIERWGLSEAQACACLGLEPGQTEMLHEILKGVEPATSRDTKDRLRILLLMRKILRGLYRNDPAAEGRWLRSPVDAWSGESPLDRMSNGGIEGLIEARDYLRWYTGL